MACALSTPDRLVPDTHAYTHDGQRHVPRDRPDIRAQLTGSFTNVDQRFTQERQAVFDNGRGSAISAVPTDCGPHAELMVQTYPLD
jgi:hypothetical protein